MTARQLYAPRCGIVAEDEAAALIRRIAFIARPSNADDVGSDLIGTVAQRHSKSKRFLTAGKSFLVSVKSGKAKIGLDRSKGHFDWFSSLDLPFFLAHVRTDDPLTVDLFLTMGHLQLMHSCPDTVQTIAFLTKTSEKWEPNNIHIDLSDIFSLSHDNSHMDFYLGPPLLTLTRSNLRDSTKRDEVANTLDSACALYLGVRSRADSGQLTRLAWTTGGQVESAVRGLTLPGVFLQAEPILNDLRVILDPKKQNNDLLREVARSAQPLFRFADALKAMQAGELKLATAKEIFADSEEPDSTPPS